MAETKQKIISDIKNYIANFPNTKYSSWYIGIAAKPRERLFIDHNVDEKNGFWIFREALSSDSAREVEEYLINQLKTKGDVGGGDNTTKFVYAYIITSTTK